MHDTSTVQFLGLGGHSSGSGFVYTYLRAHPEVCIPTPAVHFFSDTEAWQQGQSWYESHFASCRAGQVRGECTSVYLYHSEVPERVLRAYPDMKMIAVVCNPVERLYREYRRAKKHEVIASDMSLKTYIETYPDALKRGLFGSQLRAYFDLVSPLQLHVAVHEDRYEDPVQYMQRIYEFLEIDPEFVAKPLRQFVTVDPDEKVVQPWYYRLMLLPFAPLRWLRLDRLARWVGSVLRRWYHRFYPAPQSHTRSRRSRGPKPAPIDERLRHALEEYYAADVQLLSELIHRDVNVLWGIDRPSR